MRDISFFLKKYSPKIDFLDLQLIIAYVLGRNREFILTHPELSVNNEQQTAINKFIKRRINHEPLAYILGEKEFYGMKFKVNKNVLIPRPETEMIVDLAARCIKHGTHIAERRTQNAERVSLCDLRSTICDMRYAICDIGTGSGNIIVAITKQLLNYESRITNYSFYGIDISEKALRVAKRNAKIHKLDKKIKFLKGDLLNPFIHNSRSIIHNSKNLLITANLPYLSKKNYNSCSLDIKNYEPKSALISQKEGLAHYEKLLKQIDLSVIGHQSSVIAFIEIGPEQRIKIKRLIKKYFPKSKTSFHKDLSGRNRICELEISNGKCQISNQV